MSLLIETKQLGKKYRSNDVETTALAGLDLQVEQGSFTAIMGPSGCGKSTLLHLLGMLDQPDSGTYHFNGAQAFPNSARNRDQLILEGIGFVFQQFNLIDDLSIFDNVQLPTFYQGWKGAKRKKQVNEILDQVGIGHRAMHKPQQLSGGQQQRVAIARAIVTEPLLILADEPTGNLDSENGKQVMDILSELNKQGKTIIMVTHSERDAQYAHQVLQMKDGRII